MIKTLSIKNYKSIKSLDIKPSRINVFIGEHNSGKSNILEALSWFSSSSLEERIYKAIFRFSNATDFFYDHDLTRPLEVSTNDECLIIRYAKNANGALLNNLEGLIYHKSDKIDTSTLQDFNNINSHNDRGLSNFYSFRMTFNGELQYSGGNLNTSFRTYIFKRLNKFASGFRPFLNPPFGENIPSLLISSNELKDTVSNIFREKGFRLMLKPVEQEIAMAKDQNDELYSYPYSSISETLQRIIFFTLAIKSNKKSVLVFDEPESNTFPMYRKQLAELISYDTSNQYFIATHDPYILGSLTSKTPTKDLSVFVTKMENYQTIVTKVSKKDLSIILDKGADVYFNLGKLVK